LDAFALNVDELLQVFALCVLLFRGGRQQRDPFQRAGGNMS